MERSRLKRRRSSPANCCRRQQWLAFVMRYQPTLELHTVEAVRSEWVLANRSCGSYGIAAANLGGI